MAAPVFSQLVDMVSAPSPHLCPSQPVPDHKLPPAPDSVSRPESRLLAPSRCRPGTVPSPRGCSRAPNTALYVACPPMRGTVASKHPILCSRRRRLDPSSVPGFQLPLSASLSPGHRQLRLPTLPQGVGSSPDPAPAPRLQIQPRRLPFSCSWLHVPERQAHHLSSLPFPPLSLSLPDPASAQARHRSPSPSRPLSPPSLSPSSTLVRVPAQGAGEGRRRIGPGLRLVISPLIQHALFL